MSCDWGGANLSTKIIEHYRSLCASHVPITASLSGDNIQSRLNTNRPSNKISKTTVPVTRGNNSVHTASSRGRCSNYNNNAGNGYHQKRGNQFFVHRPGAETAAKVISSIPKSYPQYQSHRDYRRLLSIISSEKQKKFKLAKCLKNWTNGAKSLLTQKYCALLSGEKSSSHPYQVNNGIRLICFSSRN